MGIEQDRQQQREAVLAETVLTLTAERDRLREFLESIYDVAVSAGEANDWLDAYGTGRADGTMTIGELWDRRDLDPLRDQSIIVPQDAAVWDLLGRWRNAPSDTASGPEVRE